VFEKHDAFIWFYRSILHHFFQRRQTRRAFRRAEDSFGRTNFFGRRNQLVVGHGDCGSAEECKASIIKKSPIAFGTLSPEAVVCAF